ncbi:hypothetical protein [Bacillus cereus]
MIQNIYDEHQGYYGYRRIRDEVRQLIDIKTTLRHFSEMNFYIFVR